MQAVLLLTGTIKPFLETSKTGRANVFDREMDYYKALKFYLSKGFKVVFVENSNYDSAKISSLKEKFPNLEYLTFYSEKSVLGKSWGEVEIINYALENSRFLAEKDYIIKISGRYIIKNITAMIKGTNEVEKYFYVNPTRNLRWADTRLMLMKKDFYTRYFYPNAAKFLNEEKLVFMENIFIKAVLIYLVEEGGELNLWPKYPAYDAYDGTHDERVSFNFLKILKYNIYYKVKKFVFKHRA
ncbi:hypothetical protein [Algoriphagus sanaruensis]|uniref:Glycosyl transferase family 2 n=1 Tax=Algoriphagus sanaruensis TaxID=1727163 RepID=A0A142ER18_9BACT|nr:hypothetical protein [Algoriphagus sanaruensis]AMQ57573.1 hypothetical protein AO498_14075 [Algoriphagus sanaruensis]